MLRIKVKVDKTLKLIERQIGVKDIVEHFTK